MAGRGEVRRVVGEQHGGLGGYRERVEGGMESERRRSGGVCGVGGAAGCFTPGLFKETAQGMPLAHLTKHFPSPSFFSPPPRYFPPFCFFLEHRWVRSSQILWAPKSFPPTAI